MYGDAAFPYQDRYGVGIIEVVFCDGAREIPVLMVVVDPALVGAWDNQETSVLLGHFVYRYSNGQEVVIGMGIEGPVLMPLHWTAKFRQFHVEFVTVTPQIRTDQLGNYLQDFFVMQRLGEDLVLLDRFL